MRSEHIYNTTYKSSPPFCWGGVGGGGWGGGNFQSQILKREILVGVKEFLSWIFAPEGGMGAYFVSCQKRFLKIRYSFEGSISNVDLGLF